MIFSAKLRSGLLFVLLFALVFAPLGNIAYQVQAQPLEQTSPKITLTPCQLPLGIGATKTEIDAQCGTVSVSENRASQTSRRIELAVVVLPPLETGATGLPIFHLEGGPGGSAILNYGQAWFTAYTPFRKQHPVVLVDQRGTGKSASLQCTEVTDQALSDLKSTISADDANNDAIARYAACLQRLSVTNDPQYYTSAAAAADLDSVRAALGYDQILVFGNSYGTWLGQFYLKLFGEHVAGMVLDSVVGPWNRPDLDAPANGQAALDKIIALCEANALCNSTYPDLPGKLETALEKLKQRPFNISGTSGITGKSYPVGMTADKLRYALFQMLYSVSNATLIPQAIAEAARQIYTFPATVLTSGAEYAADFISIGLNLSVTCAETVPFVTPELIEENKTESFLLGSEEEYVKSNEAQIAACKAWRSAELAPEDVAPIKSDRPVLILSGELDPVTPIKYGEETQARLSNSRLVTFPYQAHGVIINSQCARGLVERFFNNPAAKLDVSCRENDLAPVFSGAYKGEVVAYSVPEATFIGTAPKGWKPEQIGPLTFFTSPDDLQYIAVGVYKNMDVKAARAAVLKAVEEKYGTVQVQQELTQNVLFISITVVAHALERPDQSFTGIITLRPDGKNVIALWQAAPNAWFQAVSLVYLTQMIGAIRAK